MPSSGFSSNGIPERLGTSSPSDDAQLLIRGSEDIAAVLGDDDGILDANAAEVFLVNSRLDRDGHAGTQLALVALADARRFVDLETEPVAGGVDEGAIQAVSLQDIARGAVHS